MGLTLNYSSLFFLSIKLERWLVKVVFENLANILNQIIVGEAWQPNHITHFVSLWKFSSVICSIGRSAVLHNLQSMPSLLACFLPERAKKWFMSIGNITACSYLSLIISLLLEIGSLLPSQDHHPNHVHTVFFSNLGVMPNFSSSSSWHQVFRNCTTGSWKCHKTD